MLNEMDLSRIDLNLLVLFEAVMDERHVARAAGRLHVSPSAVSHGLGRLRELLRDPLFLRHPKGVVPTERATSLAAGIVDVLARARAVIGSAEPFDPRRTERTFRLAAPEAATAVLLPALLKRIRRTAPQVRLSYANLIGRFDAAYERLDQREIDVAVIPVGEVPARFAARDVVRRVLRSRHRVGHPLGTRPSLDRYCAMDHVIVSQSGELHGLVDRRLEAHAKTRRVVLAVPEFLLALIVVEQSDLVAALPKRFVETHARRFRVRTARPPLALDSDPLRAVATRAALQDTGIAWLVGELAHAASR